MKPLTLTLIMSTVILVLIFGTPVVLRAVAKPQSSDLNIARIQDQDDRQDAFNKRLTEVEKHQESQDEMFLKLTSIVDRETDALMRLCAASKQGC